MAWQLGNLESKECKIYGLTDKTTLAGQRPGTSQVSVLVSGISISVLTCTCTHVFVNQGLAQRRLLTHLEHKSPFDRLGRPYHDYVSISKDAAWHSVEEPKKPAAVAAYDVSSTSLGCVHTYVCTYVSVCAHVCVSTAKDICFSLEMLVQSVRNISLLVNIHTIMHTHTRTSTYYVSMLVCTDVLEIAWLHFISVFYSFAGPE